MTRMQGYSKIAMSYSTGWLSLFSSGNAARAATNIAPLLVAFQVHGLLCCVPYAVLAFRGMLRVGQLKAAA